MKKTNLLFALVLVVGVAGFYWMSIRPSQIRAECAKGLANSFQLSGGESKDAQYQLCLHSQGL